MTDSIARACRQWRQQYEMAAAYPWRASFTTDEIHAAEIEAARDAVLRRLYDWIITGANDAQTSFTASELRNVAREVEYRIHAAREEGRRAGLEFARGYIEGAPDPGFYRQEELEAAFLTWRRQALRAIESKAKE